MSDLHSPNSYASRLGHSERELRRLMFQAQLMRPMTLRLLRDAGITEGMRILDVGTGMGDVALLAAEAVGSTGHVLGIDMSAEATEGASNRAASMGTGNIEFKNATLEQLAAKQAFDMVVGRFVLVHQPDPSGMLRAAALATKPGGAIAFLEVCTSPPIRSLPKAPLWDYLGSALMEVFRNAAQGVVIADHLAELFQRAELPRPKLFSETPVGGGVGTLLCTWYSEAARVLWPRLAATPGFIERVGDPETLEERLLAEAARSDSQIYGPRMVGAWTRL